MSVSTTATNPTQAVLDILEGYTAWPGQEPNEFRIEQVTPRSQMSGSNELAIYGWTSSPVENNDFAAEGDTSEDTTTVQLLIKGLDESETEATAKGTQALLEEYNRDNGNLTEFHEINPSQVRDLRDENNTRSTDPYIFGIQVFVERLRSRGLD